MASLPGRLGTLNARDVMTKLVTVIRKTDTLSDAIGMLRDGRITGAPVVDGDGKLAGILSISDLVGSARGTDEETDASEPPSVTPLAHGEDTTTWDLFERAVPLDESQAEETVGRRMTTSVTSVTLDATLVDVARAMCDGHWHRVPVVDDEGSLVGIISTMDVLAALVNVADESA